jgi:hypothetical protein
MLTPREIRFIALQRKNRKHYLIIFFVLLIVVIVGYPVVTRIGLSFVEQAFEITFSYQARKGLCEGLLMTFVGGGLFGLSLGLFLGFYILNTRWLKIIDKFVPRS